MAQELPLDINFLNSNEVPRVCILSGKTKELIYFNLKLKRHKGDEDGQNALRFILLLVMLSSGILMRLLIGRLFGGEITREHAYHEFPLVVNHWQRWKWHFLRYGGLWFLLILPIELILCLSLATNKISHELPVSAFITCLIVTLAISLAWLIYGWFNTVRFSAKGFKVLRVRFPARLNHVHETYALAYEDWKKGKRNRRQDDRVAPEDIGDLIP